MSNAVFPSLIGLTSNVTRRPTWTTNILETVSGREIRGTYQIYPMYEFELAYDVLRDAKNGTDLATLIGFFLARQGSFDNFLYSDPQDSSVTTMNFGTGDGVTTQFQLTRTYGSTFTFAEPVQNVNGTPQIFVNGVLQTVTTNYTLSSTGLVTFVTAPGSGLALTWTGSYYYRCRFLEDKMDFRKIMLGLWSIDKVSFIGSPGNYV